MTRRALVVEDDLETRCVLVEILEAEGCVVDAAPDGELAARYLSSQDYSVVLLDLGLPRTSGADVMEHIACTRPQTLANTIIVTGSDTVRVRALFPEVCDALAKPILPAQLKSAIGRCSRKPPLPQPPRPKFLRLA